MYQIASVTDETAAARARDHSVGLRLCLPSSSSCLMSFSASLNCLFLMKSLVRAWKSASGGREVSRRVQACFAPAALRTRELVLELQHATRSSAVQLHMR